MCGIVGLFLKRPGLERQLGAHACDDARHHARSRPRQRRLRRLWRRHRRHQGHGARPRPRGAGGRARPRRRSARHPCRAARAAGARSRRCTRRWRGTPRSASSAKAGAWSSTRRSACPPTSRAASACPTWPAPTASATPAWRPRAPSRPTARHPFSTGPDQCLVHNGSLSNHNALRRDAGARGLRVRDRERHRGGGRLPDLADARGRQPATRRWTPGSSDLDGFYTFVVGTRTGFAVLRDPIACKPAVMAETDDWVAFGTEYRALVDLPGIDAGPRLGAGAGQRLRLGTRS